MLHTSVLAHDTWHSSSTSGVFQENFIEAARLDYIKELTQPGGGVLKRCRSGGLSA